MAKTEDLFTARKSLKEICDVPEKIISVYSLEKHVWADFNAEASRRGRKPELQTIDEFQINPVRPFLTDILRNMAAPYKPERKENSIGQGYWIQAEFGSGKSHLLCFLSTIAFGGQEAWDIVAAKEQQSGRGKRETLYRFYEEGLKSKSEKGKGIFVVVKTLVGAGGGTVGLTDKGQRLGEYILDAVKEQMQIELGKNISLYPAELLADRFISEDMDRYRNDLRKFLRSSKFFEEDEFEEVEDFIRDIQQNKSPEYKRSCGKRLWRFYTEYLKVKPHIEAETEDILRHMVEVVLAEGYTGVLLVLDEVSLFMKNRDEDQRTDDEKTLVVLSNRLAKVYNLPIWTVCSAQQAIESKMGVKNIIADDRLKLVKLLEEDKDYYDIALARVRTIKDPSAIGNYYIYYKRGFTWPNGIGEQEFRHFFPFHKPALEVLRAITYELTTARSAIHFMHQTLKHQIKAEGRELIRLWELFDEAIRYEEDPSGVHAGLVAIKTNREMEYRAYEVCKRQIDGLTKGYLKVNRDKGVKVIQTLFLYFIARILQQGLTPEQLANSVLIERDAQANPDENIQHYETLADNLRKELRQIVQGYDEDHQPLYRFDPVFTGIDPREEFRKARDEAETNELMQKEAWEHLLALDEWPVRTRQTTIDLSWGVNSIFKDIAASKDATLEIVWQGRQIEGAVGMRDLGKLAADNLTLPAINTDQTDLDYSVYIGAKPISSDFIAKLLVTRNDPRILTWSPDELKSDEKDRLIDFAAYRKLVHDWERKETEDAVAVITWTANTLQTEMGKITKIVDNSYARGRFDAINHSQMPFHVAGELRSIVTPLVDRVLSSVYESNVVKFEPPVIFRKEEGVKVINGIVKTGVIPKGAKPNQNISAAQNFGFGLMIIKKTAEKELDVTDNPFVTDMWNFIDSKLTGDGQTMKPDTLYKNFMGIGGPKDYGLTRRMVQIYLLCLARQGKIRIGITSKAGLLVSFIDYSNIEGIEFSVKILDAFTDVQKMAKPENWEVLRPYAEKLLSETIPTTHDDAVISEYRAKLSDLFAKEKDESQRVRAKAGDLFDALKTMHPYEKEINQVSVLFSSDLGAGNDIALLLYGLKTAFGYQAFDANASTSAEVDDLANKIMNYRDLQRFVGYDTEVRTAYAYCIHRLPDLPDLKTVQTLQRIVAEKLAAIQTFIDSEVKLKTELIGKLPPEAGETGTLGAMIHEYGTLYVVLHDGVINTTDGARQEIEYLLDGDDMKALKILEGVKALQPSVSSHLETILQDLAGTIFSCPTPSRTSIMEQLKRGPLNECGLTFANAATYLDDAKTASDKGKDAFDEAFNRKMEIFLNPAVRKRLEQGKSLPFIAGLLQLETISEIRPYLTSACLEDPAVVDVINKYLKRIEIRHVKIANFKPSIGMVEKDQLAQVAREFESYLKEQMDTLPSDPETLPMLQLE